MNDEEKTWHEIDQAIDLYKFYLDLIIKSANFIFAITGAMVAWYFIHNDNVLIKFSLILPLIINTGFFIACCLARKPVIIMKREFEKNYATVNSNTYFDMSPLLYVLKIFLFTYAIITIGLIVVIFSHLACHIMVNT